MVREEDWFPRIGDGDQLYSEYYSAYWDEWARLFGYEDANGFDANGFYVSDGILRGQFCQFMGIPEGRKIADDNHAGDIDNIVDLAKANPKKFQKFRALVRLGATPNGGK